MGMQNVAAQNFVSSQIVLCRSDFVHCSENGPELAYRLRLAQPTNGCPFIFFIYHYICLCITSFMTFPLWLAVGPQSL